MKMVEVDVDGESSWFDGSMSPWLSIEKSALMFKRWFVNASTAENDASSYKFYDVQLFIVRSELHCDNVISS